ncbi:sulfatase-like hydrolase/transferase [Sphingobacterium sp. SGL-16]|uniref:sulfatase-like hydrolase/transferase n=1 Tax=Sphingobacterium sp. SGL-16 TaxID=2710883 RepID=UPI0013E9EF43|nr:sulfatase-like hydrolase/transferase [Sphingobacterium sp. SGL-16]NGM74486.1 sulfatase-like hydrolase/transferase [Sphingobacterium sp. SGL-16]
MIDYSHFIYEIVVWLFLLYSIVIFLIYSWVGIYAFGALKKYTDLNQYTDYKLIASNPNAPAFSIIAPAYNEGLTIVDNVRSLLSLYYSNLEIIIVNDGSKDDSIDKLVKSYNLELIPFDVVQVIPTKEIKGIYKSKNPAFKKLIVVDKYNGGKADALNVGINVSSGKYIVCIDVDCILEQDALLKLAKPFMDQTDERVIACGGVIRLANNCKIVDGKVVEVNLPKKWLGRFQALEYIRAFVLGRMAWSRASGLILISGAFGAFDKELVLKCGGYDPKTVGEDMELVVRMRRYMEEQKQKYKVLNISDPLCWTEVPESTDILKKQRNRWMRGTIETLWKHRKLMFNPSYGRLGMISMPYWFFFEFLGPLVEFLGYCIFILFLVFGIINWPFFFTLFILVIASGILYSIYAILLDLMSHQVYTKRKDLLTLIGTAILEPFFFHGRVVMAGVSGLRDYFRKQHSWGEMTRQGFQQSNENESIWIQIKITAIWALRNYAPIAFVFLILYMANVGLEAYWYNTKFDNQIYSAIYFNLFIDNLVFVIQLVAAFSILYLLLLYLGFRYINTLIIAIFSIFIVIQVILFLYFSESQNLLGADIFFYSYDELKQILKSSGMLNLKNIALLLLVILFAVIPLFFVSRYKFNTPYAGAILTVTGLILVFLPFKFTKNIENRNEFYAHASVSKWKYFLESNFFNYVEENFPWANKMNVVGKQNINNLEPYPFLRKEDTKDFLGNYLAASESTPNLVILILEGLGHAYSSSNGYIGNFTPFLNSLKEKSLYWENCLSSSGRTFAVLPSILGSLPFAKNGFLELDTYPVHFNLQNIFKYNGFQTSFYYGGDASFDNMKKYMQHNNIDNLMDIKTFKEPYKKLPSLNGESWGYEDQAVLNKMLVSTPQSSSYFNLLLTLSTHSPFLINNQEYFEKLVENQIKILDLKPDNIKLAKSYKKQLASVMNVDEALKSFFEEYKKRSDFANTIFIITGDHSMPEINLQDKIDRYHVPLIIYSPLLKSSATFNQVVSHFDIAPTLLAFYRNNYAFKTPNQVTWIGKGLETGAAPNSNGIPIMQSKTQQQDFVYANYHMVEGKVFNLNTNLTEEKNEIKSVAKLLSNKFDEYKAKNEKLISTNFLIPDSLYNNFFNATKDIN